ncbi:MAG: DUF3489 domain-containing protein [Sphingobium sp.]
MTGITRLTVIQLILLATAARRDNRSLLPPPETLGDGPARIRKAVEALIRRGLAAEADLAPGADTWRTEGERAVGAVITDAGRAAIAADVDASSTAITPTVQIMPAASAGETSHVTGTTAPPRTKTAAVIELMRRDTGATLVELTAATGWLPHTTRAALTGLRKKGHAIVRSKRDDMSCYTLASGAAA